MLFISWWKVRNLQTGPMIKPYSHFLAQTSSPPTGPPAPYAVVYPLCFCFLFSSSAPTPRGNSAGHSSWLSAKWLLFWPNYLNGLAWRTRGQDTDGRSHHKPPGWLRVGVPVAASQDSVQPHQLRISNLGKLGGENKNRGVGLQQGFTTYSTLGLIILCSGDKIVL